MEVLTLSPIHKNTVLFTKAKQVEAHTTAKVLLENYEKLNLQIKVKS